MEDRLKEIREAFYAGTLFRSSNRDFSECYGDCCDDEDDDDRDEYD